MKTLEIIIDSIVEMAVTAVTSVIEFTIGIILLISVPVGIIWIIVSVLR